ncbi:yurR [Scenedesmus sp. PABB004]|nr:yurR [Scenedesmus sp. PABB004]
MSTPPPRVVVVGAGIIGAAVAKHLAERGVRVIVLEAAPGHAQGATAASWAWLNANYKEPKHYFDLSVESMRLWRECGDVATFTGCLFLHDERPDLAEPGYPQRAVQGAELLELEPGLCPALAARCTHARLYPSEGWTDPVEATDWFLARARAQGAEVLYGQQVEGVARGPDGRARGVVVAAPAGGGAPAAARVHEAGAVVIAAGGGSAALAASLGHELPLLHKPAVVLLTAPLPPGLVRRMVITSGAEQTGSVFILQRHDGRVVIGETSPSEAATTDTSPAAAERLLRAAAAAVPALGAATAEGMQLGFRPFPADGYPVLGWLPSCPNAYLAVTHSGLTLAPLVGALVAEEVAVAGGPPSAATLERLAPYRPDRAFPAAGAALPDAVGTAWADALTGGTRAK